MMQGWPDYHLCVSIGCAAVMLQVCVVVILVWEPLAAHEEHVLQVVAHSQHGKIRFCRADWHFPKCLRKVFSMASCFAQARMQVHIRQFQTEQAFAVDVQCVTLTHRHIFGIAEAPHANSHGGGSLQSPTQVLSMTVGEEASHWKFLCSHDVE